jgi:glutathione synthase
MDPLPRIAVDKDTTFVFMLEAQSRGHEIFFIAAQDLSIDRTVPHAQLHPVSVQRRQGDHFTLGAPVRNRLDWLDVLFLRKDPPFDLSFFFDTQITSLVDRRRTLLINDPRGLREANEKLYALRFPTLIPESLVSAESTHLKAFMERLGGEMIVKPLDGCGGAGVFHLHRADRNLNAILELSTANGTRLVMAQRYLPAVRESGDKRLIVLDGEPLGAIRRIPRDDEHRGNIHVGGRVERAEVDARDREICRRMAPRLAADGLYFVGLDVIGGFVTEVNVTSPTGVQEIDRLDGTNLGARVLDFVEGRAAQLERRPPA